jgi:hypothetical protein
MGGHASKVESTNWETADGGMSTAADTISGCAPTTTVTELTCLPLKQLHLGTKYELTVLSSEDAPIDTPLYEVVDSEMFHHGFHIKDSNGDIVLRVHAGTIYKFFIYTKERNYDGQIADPGTDMYKRAVVTYDSQHRQLAVCRIRAPTDEEALLKAHQTGMPGKAVLIAEAIRTVTIALQSFLPSNPSSLVGFWKWNKAVSIPFIKDKIELKVAKNSDLVLHIALVAIARGIRAAEWKANSGDSRNPNDLV